MVIYTSALEVLLIRRADMGLDGPEFWQSVTGSKETSQESFVQTAVREVMEETSICCVTEDTKGAGQAPPSLSVLQDWQLENVYDIYPRWMHRYEPGITRNTEHLFGLEVAPGTSVCLNPLEHTALIWLPWREAAERCYSPSNAEAILMLPRFQQ